MFKIFKTIYKIINNLKVGKKLQELINHNNKYFIDNEKFQEEFLVDYFESTENVIARAYFFNSYKNKYPCKLSIFSDKKNIFLNYRFRKLYQSINAKKFNYIFFSLDYLKFVFDFKKKLKIKKFLQNTKYKTDILDFEYKELKIGKDIYDEYLYRYKQYTINLDDKKLKQIFYDFVYTIDYWINYFKKQKVIGISLSHPNLRLTAIIGKVANRHFNIPVYSVTSTYIKKNTQLYDHYEFVREDLLQIPNKFSSLSENEKKIAIEWSKYQLDRRLKGEVGVDMEYSTQSAFTSKRMNRVLKQNKKIKILICTHEFHDSPHSTGGLLFPDFYEWLLFLGNKSKNSDYEWYIKNHPDCDNWTKKIIEKFVKKFPSINLVNEKVSFLQLKDEGLNFVFTCHGTVGHECPLLDIQVVNADLNHPHIAYDFTWSPRSKAEYKNLIDNLPNLKKELNPNEIYEFYYVRNKFDLKNDLIFKSYKDAKEEQKDKKINISDIFLNEINENRHYEITQNISSKI